MSLKSLSDLDWKALQSQSFHPSPLAWEDPVLYFLLPDRFSDGNERDYLEVAGNPVTTGARRKFDWNKDLENTIQTSVTRKLAGCWWCFCRRQISGDGVTFGFPFIMGSRMRLLVAWSRLFVDEELLLAVNTDPLPQLLPGSRLTMDCTGLETSSAASIRPTAQKVEKRYRRRTATEKQCASRLREDLLSISKFFCCEIARKGGWISGGGDET